MADKLTATQQAEVQVTKITDRRGNVAAVDDPKWESSDESIVVVKTDGNDPLKAVVTAVGPVGEALVTFKGDADRGEGVIEVIGVLPVVVAAGNAEVIEITMGTPTEAP